MERNDFDALMLRATAFFTLIALCVLLSIASLFAAAFVATFFVISGSTVAYLEREDKEEREEREAA